MVVQRDWFQTVCTFMNQQVVTALSLLLQNPQSSLWKDPALSKVNRFYRDSRCLDQWVPVINLPDRWNGIWMYRVHFEGKTSNSTRPVLMSVLDSFGTPCPRDRRRREGLARGKHEKELRSSEFTRSGWTHGPRKGDSAVLVPGFPMSDRAFLCRDRSLYRKLDHVRGEAHVVVSTRTALRGGGGVGGEQRQSASVDKTPKNLTTLERTSQSSQPEEKLTKLQAFLWQHIYLILFKTCHFDNSKGKVFKAYCCYYYYYYYYYLKGIAMFRLVH